MMDLEYTYIEWSDPLEGHVIERIYACEVCGHILTPGEQKPSMRAKSIICPVCGSSMLHLTLWDRTESCDVTCWEGC